MQEEMVVDDSRVAEMTRRLMPLAGLQDDVAHGLSVAALQAAVDEAFDLTLGDGSPRQACSSLELSAFGCSIRLRGHNDVREEQNRPA